MKTFGNILEIKGAQNTWRVQKLIPSGMATVKWGVWKNGTHIGSELTKRQAISVIEHWK